MFDAVQLTRYLVDSGVLAAEEVVEGRLTISDATSRHRNFIVEVGGGRCLFVKQSLDPVDAFLRREAEVYARLETLDGAASPRLLWWDDSIGLLVVERVDGADARQLREEMCGLDGVAIGAAIGSALAALHDCPIMEPAGQAMVPGVLVLHRPSVDILRDASGPAIELVMLVQGDRALVEGLDTLRNSYESDAFIHHDAKWDNIMVAAGADNQFTVRFVDWELAGRGDRAWDTGSVLAGYLSSWLFSLPAAGERPDDGWRMAERPLARMRPAAQAFWTSYCDGAPAREHEGSAARLLRRSMLYCAARLVQTAYEACQIASQMANAYILHLQVASNIAANPIAAAAALLGLQHGTATVAS